MTTIVDITEGNPMGLPAGGLLLLQTSPAVLPVRKVLPVKRT